MHLLLLGAPLPAGCPEVHETVTKGIYRHLTWSEPVPKDSSPHSEQRPSSMRLPKNFLRPGG
jgi:hypothetical protein